MADSDLAKNVDNTRSAKRNQRALVSISSSSLPFLCLGFEFGRRAGVLKPWNKSAELIQAIRMTFLTEYNQLWRK